MTCAHSTSETTLKRAFIFLVTIGLLAAGCGGKSNHTTKTTATTTATTPATTSPTTSTTSTASTDCNTLGINPTGMREGTCTHGGITWVIVDQNHTLNLKTLSAKLAGVRTAKTLASAAGTTTASGDFVIASVTIKNKLPARQTFDQANTQQAGLILNGAVFKEAVGAESHADANSCLQVHAAIQPGNSETCDVIFDVPTTAADVLGKHGSGDLFVVNFGSDLAASVPPQTIGQIRLYH